MAFTHIELPPLIGVVVVQIIAPYLIGQKIAFKLYHEWLEDESRDEEDNTIAWSDAEWRIDEEIADIRGAVMGGLKDMLEQNNVCLI